MLTDRSHGSQWFAGGPHPVGSIMKPFTRETVTDRRQPSVRWNAVIAGALVALGTWLLLQLLITGGALTAIDADHIDRLGSYSIGTSVGSILAPLLAMFAGGLVAGRLASFYELLPPTLGDQFATCRQLLAWPQVCPQSTARFVETDNGDTITDNLTNLVWERKAKSSAANELRTWSDVGNPAVGIEDGTGFAAHLRALNAATYGGSNGWRLPTIAELISTLGPPTEPTSVLVDGDLECRDPGSFAGLAYWSATPALHPRTGDCPEHAWNVIYGTMTTACEVTEPGAVAVDGAEGGRRVRAVRGGL